jgi:hypothetical protein
METNFMTKEKITINGLLDGISVLEKDNTNEQPSVQTDMLYNDQEPYDLNLGNMVPKIVPYEL